MATERVGFLFQSVVYEGLVSYKRVQEDLKALIRFIAHAAMRLPISLNSPKIVWVQCWHCFRNGKKSQWVPMELLSNQAFAVNDVCDLSKGLGRQVSDAIEPSE